MDFQSAARFGERRVMVTDYDETAVEVNAKVVDEDTGEVICECESGGGGESDFSTATLRIVNEGTGYSSVNPVPIIDTFNDEDFLAVSDLNVSQGSTKEFTLVLYKDRADLSIGLANNIKYSENVIYDEVESIYIVSGDATITLEGTGQDA